MARDGVDESEGDLTDAALRSMRQWRTAHPTASFAEIEVAVEERLQQARAQLLEAAVTGVARDGGGELDGARCPDCGQALAARGRGQRTLTTRGNRPLRLERAYGVCPACEVGLFPPR